MRGVLYIVSLIFFVLSIVAMFAGLSDAGRSIPGAGYEISGAIAMLLLAGILWMLTEISCQITDLTKKLGTESPSAASAIAAHSPQQPRA
jgi:hypothetical protein